MRMEALLVYTAIGLLAIIQPSLQDDMNINMDKNRYYPDQRRKDIIECYVVPKDPYTNSIYAFGDLNDTYGTTYPQYQYRPYDDDCDRGVYGEYQRYTANFKGYWYSNERYPEVKYKDNKSIYYRDKYVYTKIDDNEIYPPYDGNEVLQEVCCKTCTCWEFDSNDLPLRPQLPSDLPRNRQRIEYRQLSTTQRQSFHDALTRFKLFGYDIMVDLHRQICSPYAHHGASFLPWHREYLFRLENKLYEHGYTGPGLPYYDSTLDQQLPNPSQSAVWTDAYLGNIDGLVTSGPFAFWPTTTDCQGISTTLFRNGINGPLGRCFLMSDYDVQYVYTKTCFRDITRNTDDKFEGDHGAIHTFVGGHMGDPSCAPNDPFFFLHHAFIDCVWEEFRMNYQQSPITTEYPSQLNGDDVGSPPSGQPNGFEWNAPMLPFAGLLNGHGISTWYQAYYHCEDRPIRCVTHADCGGDLLWCDNGRCRGKVMLTGSCEGLPDIACDATTCRTGAARCRGNQCMCNRVVKDPVRIPALIPDK